MLSQALLKALVLKVWPCENTEVRQTNSNPAMPCPCCVSLGKTTAYLSLSFLLYKVEIMTSTLTIVVNINKYQCKPLDSRACKQKLLMIIMMPFRA